MPVAHCSIYWLKCYTVFIYLPTSYLSTKHEASVCDLLFHCKQIHHNMTKQMYDCLRLANCTKETLQHFFSSQHSVIQVFVPTKGCNHILEFDDWLWFQLDYFLVDFENTNQTLAKSPSIWLNSWSCFDDLYEKPISLSLHVLKALKFVPFFVSWGQV